MIENKNKKKVYSKMLSLKPEKNKNESTRPDLLNIICLKERKKWPLKKKKIEGSYKNNILVKSEWIWKLEIENSIANLKVIR